MALTVNAVNLMGIKLVSGVDARMKQPDGTLTDGGGTPRTVYAEPRILIVGSLVVIRSFISDFTVHRTSNTGRYTYTRDSQINASNFVSAQTYYNNDAEHQYGWVYTVGSYGPGLILYASSARQVWFYYMEYTVPASDTRNPGIEFHMEDPGAGLALTNGDLYTGHWAIGNKVGTYGTALPYEEMALYYTGVTPTHVYRFQWWAVKRADKNYGP